MNRVGAKDKIAPASESGSGLFQRLEVIDDTEPRMAAFNMAADECLLEQLGPTPVLRLYRWLNPTLSCGYFTPFADLGPDGGRDLVRRWTGGGIVEHGADFTYALAVPRGELAALGTPEDSYRILHHALARALAQAGLQADPLTDEMCAEKMRPVQAPGGYCFARPVVHDLMLEGRKLAGAAQRRTRRGLLHQGSVQGCDDVEGAGNAQAGWRERLARSLPKVLCGSPVRRGFTPAEEAGAHRLAEAKYATQAWLERW